MTAATIRLIHVAARQLGMDDDTRRHLQLLTVGKASLRDMTDAEQERVVKALEERGFKPGFKGGSKGTGKAGRRAPAARGDVRFCHVLWGKLVRAGAVDRRGAAGLNAFVRARFADAWGAAPIDIDAMRDAEQIAAVAEALKAMCRRAGIDLEARDG